MAFPASNGALSDVLERACRTAIQMKALAERTSARLASEDASATEVIELFKQLRSYRSALSDAAAAPGIVAYAQDQLGDGALDVATEFNAMLAAVDAVTGWVQANFPRDGSGYLLAQTWGVDRPADRMFSPAQTAGLRTQLDALAATVA